MRTKDRNLVIAVVLLCVLIAVLAPFIASPDPDGLEKTAEQLMPNPETEPTLQSPFPDYTIEPFGEIGEILALILGVLVTLILAYLVGKIIKKRQATEL